MSISVNDLDRISDLPQVIMEEILMRLSVKSLCRLKAVSKLWNSVISGHQFGKAHLAYNQGLNSNSRYVFFQRDGNSWLLDYEAYGDEDPNPELVGFNARDNIGLVSIRMVPHAPFGGADATPYGSSCGLVFLVAFEKSSSDPIFLICNPILQQFRKIATPPPLHKWSFLLYGFGYVSSLDDCKIFLGIRYISRGVRHKLYVFSLRDNSWRIVDVDDHIDTFVRYCSIAKMGVLVNDHLHWWAKTIQHDNSDNRIMAFDLHHEVFKEIPIPDVLVSKVRSELITWHFRTVAGIQELGGCLCLLVFVPDNIELWMLKQYGNSASWIRLYNLSIQSSPDYYLRDFFGFTKSGKFLVEHVDKEFNYFIFLVDPNPSNPKLTKIAKVGRYKATVNYVKSLVSPLGFDKSTQTTS